MRKLPIILSLSAGLLAILSLGEPQKANSEQPSASFHRPQESSVLKALRRVVLEEPPEEPIGEVADFAVLPDGRLLVVDGMSASVRVHNKNGFLDTILGGRGEGPGEFKNPSSLAVMEDGRFLVGDFGTNRVTRFSSTLELDEVFTIPGVVVFGVETIPGGFLVMTYRRFEDTVIRCDNSGNIVESAHPFEPEVFSVPYWQGPSTQFLATGAGEFLVGTTVLYPIRRYGFDGVSKSDFGFPPPSWIEPVRPKRGQFVGLNREDRLNAWVRSFSIISGVNTYRDLVLVSHGRFVPNSRNRYQIQSMTIDVYNWEGTKLEADVALPGRILSGGEYVYLLTSEPPGPWIVQIAEVAVS